MDDICGSIYEGEDGRMIIECKCCGLRFEQLDQLNEHLRVITTIPELPVECLTKIFKYLAPNQLATLSKVCGKFKDLAEKVMELYFDPGPISIQFDRIPETAAFISIDPRPFSIDFGRLPETADFPFIDEDNGDEFEDNEKGIDEREDFYKCDHKKAVVRTRFSQCNFVCRSRYEVSFHSVIRRLFTTADVVDGYKKLFQFIRGNCHKEIISLVIYDRQTSCDSIKDRQIYGEIAKDQLEHLKYLEVKDVPFHCLYQQLLQYANQLEFLNVLNHGGRDCNSDRLCAHYDFAWTDQTYPHLEKLFLRTVDNQFDLMPMIERHPKLRNVACNSPATIKSILQSDIKFNYIALIFSQQGHWDEDDDCAILRLYDEMVEFGQSNRFETFELCLEGQQGLSVFEIVGLIYEIPNVTGLHAGDFIIYDPEDYDHPGLKLPLIEKLCIYHERYIDFQCTPYYQRIDDQFPNLRELRIVLSRPTEHRRMSPADVFRDYVQGILYNAKSFMNLKELHCIHADNFEFSWNDVIEMNFIRSKRLNPSKITVYVDPVCFHKLNENIVELQFIEIKPWIHGGCDLGRHCRPPNPYYDEI